MVFIQFNVAPLNIVVIQEDQHEMFAVMPLTWCPHLVEVQPLPEGGIDASQQCDECWHVGENWLCLTCYTVSYLSNLTAWRVLSTLTS